MLVYQYFIYILSKFYLYFIYVLNIELSEGAGPSTNHCQPTNKCCYNFEKRGEKKKLFMMFVKIKVTMSFHLKSPAPQECHFGTLQFVVFAGNSCEHQKSDFYALLWGGAAPKMMFLC